MRKRGMTWVWTRSQGLADGRVTFWTQGFLSGISGNLSFEHREKTGGNIHGHAALPELATSFHINDHIRC